MAALPSAWPRGFEADAFWRLSRPARKAWQRRAAAANPSGSPDATTPLLTKIRTPGRFWRRNSPKIAGRPASENSVKRTCCVFRPGSASPPGGARSSSSRRLGMFTQSRARPPAVTGATGMVRGRPVRRPRTVSRYIGPGWTPAAVEQREQPVPRFAPGGGYRRSVAALAGARPRRGPACPGRSGPLPPRRPARRGSCPQDRSRPAARGTRARLRPR